VADPLESEVLALRARVTELEQRLERVAEAGAQGVNGSAPAQVLLDNLPHMAWMKDTEGVFLAVNEAFAQACGHPKANILGKTDRDVWPAEHADKYMEDDRGRRRQVVRDVQDAHP
jgi:PAS domain-containing protein